MTPVAGGAGRDPRPLFLLTDFGAGSWYPGVMKAVIAAVDRRLRVEDVFHGVRPGAVLEGAFVLRGTWAYLPEDAVVAAVVDPGVGSARRVLALRDGRRTVLAPDNGLLTGILKTAPGAAVFDVRRPDLELAGRSATFHGRDVFAPIAAHLARGGNEEDLGPRVSDPVVLDAWAPRSTADGLEGVVVHVDAFGNLVTNIEGASLRGRGGELGVVAAGRAVVNRLSRTYSDERPGVLLAYVGSTGHLELAVRDGRADRMLGLGPGAEVAVRFSNGSGG